MRKPPKLNKKSIQVHTSLYQPIQVVYFCHQRVKTGTYWSTGLADWSHWSRWTWRTLPAHRKSYKQWPNPPNIIPVINTWARQHYSHALLSLPWLLSDRVLQPPPAETNVITAKFEAKSWKQDHWLCFVIYKNVWICTLSPSSPGTPGGPAGPGRPTGPCSPSRPAGPIGPFSPLETKQVGSELTVGDRGVTRAYSSYSTQYSQKHLSLLQVQEVPEDLVFQEVQQAQRYQIAPSHQESPWKVQYYNGVILALVYYSTTELYNYW